MPPMPKNDYLKYFHDSAIQLQDKSIVRVKDFFYRNSYRDFERSSKVYILELDSANTEWVVRSKSVREKGRSSKRSHYPIEGRSKVSEKQVTRRSKRQHTGNSSQLQAAPQQGAAGPSGVTDQQAQLSNQQQQQQQQQQAGPEGARKHGREDEEHELDAALEAERLVQAVREMPSLPVPTLIHALCTDPLSALQAIADALKQHSLTYQRHELGLERSAEGGAASLDGCSKAALDLLESVAYMAEQRLQLVPPNVVILAGAPGAGKSSVANQRIVDAFPQDLVRQNERGGLLLSGPSCEGPDRSTANAPDEEMGFVYSPEVHLPDIAPFDEDDDSILPTGSNTGQVTGSPVLTHFVEVPKQFEGLQKIVVKLVIEGPEEVTSTLKAVRHEEAVEEGGGEGAGALERACAIFNCKATDLQRDPAELKLPEVFKFPQLQYEVNAHHPDAFKQVRSILIYTRSGYWGMVKEAHVYVPSTRQLPTIMDAPGLAGGDPFRVKLVQDAMKLHSPFALVVLTKSREGSDGLPHNLHLLGLPGAMKAFGSSSNGLPLPVYLWYNDPPEINFSKSMSIKRKTYTYFMENKDKHGPDAAYRKILPDVIREEGCDEKLQEAMLKRTDVGPIFLNEEHMRSVIVDADIEQMKSKGLLLQELWESRILRAHQDAQQLHPLVLMLHDVQPELSSLFEAFEADIRLLEPNKFLSMVSKQGVEFLCDRLLSVTSKLSERAGMGPLLVPSKTRGGEKHSVPEQIRAGVAQKKEQLLKDCSETAFQKRVDTARKVPTHWLNPLVRGGTRQLGVALATKPNDSEMPLGMPELALGRTMRWALNDIQHLARSLIGRQMADYFDSIRDTLKKEVTLVRSAAKGRPSVNESEWPAISMAIAVFEQLAEVRLRAAHAETSRELDLDVKWMDPDNAQSHTWRLDAYTDAMHEDAKQIQIQTARKREVNKRRLDGMSQCARTWGERVVDSILDHFVPREANDSGDSVWCKTRDVMAARSTNALSDMNSVLQGMRTGTLSGEATQLVPLSQALQATRLLVAQILVALEDAPHSPTPPPHTASHAATPPHQLHTNYAALLHSLTDHKGPASDAGAADLLLSLVGTAGASTSKGSAPAPAPASSSKAQPGGASGRRTGDSAPTSGRSTLDRARQLLQQHNTIASNEDGAPQQQQQQQQHIPHAGHEGVSCSCCKQQEDRSRMHKITKLLAQSPPLQKLAGNQALMCGTCYAELNNSFTGSNSDWCDEATVQDTWNFVSMMSNGTPRPKARAYLKQAKRQRGS